MRSEKELVETYSSIGFIEKIQKKRIIIEDDLNKFISTLSKENSVKVFENLGSRVKSTESFREKLKRKDYINTWKIPKGKNKIAPYIEKNLPDLIGFRINCFFYEDEKLIYEQLKKYYDEGKLGIKYSLDFQENILQANGHRIYKVSGKHENTSFEIQIKCSVHNIWGEVEHSRIYKGEHYDYKLEYKKNITEEVFKILKSSDQQLKTIFEEKHSKDDLIKSLFYQYTYEIIKESEKLKILSKHYHCFFSIFNTKDHLDNMKKFVSHKLIDSPFVPIALEISKPRVMTSMDFKNRYIPFEIEIIHKITSLIYEEVDSDSFVDYLINMVEVSAKSDNEFEVSDDIFGTEVENDEEIKNNIFSAYDSYFKVREEK